MTVLKEMEDALAASNAELGRTLAELKQTHEALKAAQGQVVEAEKAQTGARLAAGVAHEVRNPLNILGIGIEFLSTQPAICGDETSSAVIAELQDAIRRADAIICALMDSSKGTALHLEKCDLNALIDTALASRQREVTTRPIQVTRELADTLPTLMLDAKKIATVLDALLLNALDAMTTEDGSLIVRTKLEQVAPSEGEFDPGARSGRRQRSGDTVVALELDDTGRGIPMESLHAIFDPFFTTKATGSGTGLGLTVSRKILELHGASIAVSNRAEGGVKARIIFPC